MSNTSIPRVDVLGVHISAVSMTSAMQEISRWITHTERRYVCVTGVHGVMESQRDPELMTIHNESGLTTPDGMPMVWAGKLAGARWMTRVYGPDLMLELCGLSVQHGWSMYFYGGATGTPELLAQKLCEKFPGLRVAGTYSPPFRPLSSEEVDAETDMINQSGADIVWVGLSTPKQERWMASRRGLLQASVLLGVGAAFDIHAGLLKQAPRWAQRSGLEWLYRLLREPRRLWRRYLKNNPSFVASVLRHRPRMLPPSRSD